MGQDQETQSTRHYRTEGTRQVPPGQQQQVTKTSHEKDDVAGWKAGATGIGVGRKQHPARSRSINQVLHNQIGQGSSAHTRQQDPALQDQACLPQQEGQDRDHQKRHIAAPDPGYGSQNPPEDGFLHPVNPAGQLDLPDERRPPPGQQAGEQKGDARPRQKQST